MTDTVLRILAHVSSASAAHERQLRLYASEGHCIQARVISAITQLSVWITSAVFCVRLFTEQSRLQKTCTLWRVEFHSRTELAIDLNRFFYEDVNTLYVLDTGH